jgi:hypothetical protein
MEWPLFEKLANDMARWEGLDKAALMLQNEPLLDKDFFNYIRYHCRPNDDQLMSYNII